MGEKPSAQRPFARFDEDPPMQSIPLEVLSQGTE
jgi:hypothetical protein